MSDPTPSTEQPEEPVIRDKRLFDPATGELREQYRAENGTPQQAAPIDAEINEDLAAAQAQAAEHLADLQRLQAEYVNYRKRVDRDREVARELAIAEVVEALIPVLDDIDLARKHGELEEGPFAAIAEKVETTLQRFGAERYGAVGEEFDPNVHEALMHSTSPDVTTTSVVDVLQPGYRVGDRILRAARVAVADPQ